MYNCNAGRRVDCIIGSACIRDFSTATEVLQGKAGATGPQLHHHRGHTKMIQNVRYIKIHYSNCYIKNIKIRF